MSKVIAHLRAQWMGALALFLVIAGGTAYAANEWTGANIVNESLTGADVKGSSTAEGTLTGVDVQADSIRGADVLESSLGKIRDSNTLDNLDSTRFVQGGSALPGAFGISRAKAYFNRVTSPASGGTSTFLEIPGLLHLQLRCGDTFAAVGVISDLDGLEVYWGGTGRTEPQRSIFVKDGNIEFSATPGADVRELLIQAGTGENTFGGQRLVDITVHWALTSEGDCTATASALVQET